MARAPARARRHGTYGGGGLTICSSSADTIRQRYFALGVPETWLVSADGRLLWRQVGALPRGAAAARAAIARAVGGG